MIDDDELSREVLAVLLAEEGYDVWAVSSGEEGLDAVSGSEWARAGKTDVVLMDMQMPGISGEALGRGLRALCGARLVAMSGSRPEGSAIEFADAFLLKPFSMEEFEGAVRLEGRGSGGPEQAADGVAEDEVLDGAIFGSFQAMMGAGPLLELYGTCVRDAGRQLEEMKTAAERGQDGEFRKSAHVIKGGLGMLGARELERMCVELERAGLAGDYVATLARFPAAIGRLRRMLIARGVRLGTDDAEA